MTTRLNKFLPVVFGALATTALGGCYYGDVNSSSYASSGICADRYYDYDPYAYDDGYGYGCYDSTDYSGGFVQIGFGGGWYDSYYYPGYGLWMFDSYRNRYPLRGRYLNYWGGRRAWWKHHRGHRGDWRRDGNWRDRDRDGRHDGRPGGWTGRRDGDRDRDRDGRRGSRPGSGAGRDSGTAPPAARPPHRDADRYRDRQPHMRPGRDQLIVPPAARPSRPDRNLDTATPRQWRPGRDRPATEGSAPFTRARPDGVGRPGRPERARPAPPAGASGSERPAFRAPRAAPAPAARPAPAPRPEPVMRSAPRPAMQTGQVPRAPRTMQENRGSHRSEQ